MSTNIYVLCLKNGKYYVGKSENPAQRIQEHYNGKGSTWTRKYKPISVVQVIENVSPFDEDKITKQYMAKYGIDNVRGGSYVSETLDDIQYESVTREIWAAKDCCTMCGRKGHYIKDCFARTDIYGNGIEYEDEPQTQSLASHKRQSASSGGGSSNSCYRCGRKGHYADSCYARTTTKGYYIDSDDSDDFYDSDD